MKASFDKKKGAQMLSNLSQNTVGFAKKAVNNVKDGVSAMVDKSKANSLERKVKKYNPVLPEQYKSDTFNLPNIITIVDDAVRRDVDVCEGAIGWLGKEADVEVLYLYDEAVAFSGIRFVPVAVCDAVYYVDNFDRGRFIRSDCIFAKVQEERMAELKQVAYALGAKKCTIEITDTLSDQQAHNTGVIVSAKKKGILGKASADENVKQSALRNNQSLIVIDFEGHDSPSRPSLKWFQHDDTINRLIDMCCAGKRSVKAETLVLSASSAVTMSRNAAAAIDAAIGGKTGAGGSLTMSAEVAKEQRSKLVYHIEF